MPNEVKQEIHRSEKDRLKEITNSIEKGIRELFESGKYQQYLRTMSRFHRYSVNNQMLIFMQNPEATLVAGFNKWHDEFGRNVKKGEHGIRIIAPSPIKKKIEKEKLDPDTRLPMLDADGKVITEEKEISIPLFKPATVFDVSQTEGKPLPNLVSELHGDVKNYDVFMEALKRSAPVPIYFELMETDMDGFYNSESKEIHIREGMSEVQTVSAAVHEIAHSKLHDPNSTEMKPRWKVTAVSEGGTKRDFSVDHETEEAAVAAAEDNGWRFVDENRFEWRLEVEEDAESIKMTAKNRNTREVEAESVSYAVCQYYGIETGENSFGYIASWSKDKDLKELKASLETINKASSGLITDIDRHYAEIMKERGYTQDENPIDSMPNIENRIEIYQLKDTALAELLFSSFDRLKEVPDADNYRLVYAKPFNDNSPKAEIPEKVYEEFNVRQPDEFTGHSLSVSDIVAIRRGTNVTCHYCDSIGFKELENFRPENHLRNAEMAVEDDYGMIDGIINNGKKEQETEKKPSVLERLRQPLPERKTEKNTPQKNREMEI